MNHPSEADIEDWNPVQDGSSPGVTIRLLKAFQAGDSRALNRLLDRIGPRILLSVRSRRPAGLRAKLDSMDIVQEVMKDALPRLKELVVTSEGGLVHWFSALVSNEIKNQAAYFQRGKRAVSKEVYFDAPVESDEGAAVREFHGPDLTPSRNLVISEDMRFLEAAMDRLPEEYQEVIRQRSIEGLDFGEIGRFMNRSADAARMLYNRAIDRLTAEMAGAGIP